MKPALLLLPVLTVVSLAACDSATPPSITRSDLADALAERNRIDALPILAPAERPTGSVDYDGHVYANALIDGDSGYAILGDMDMTVDFAGGLPSVTGQVDNINLIESGTPEQLLGGSLRIEGVRGAGTIVATARGRIDGVGDDVPFRGSTNIALTMNGTFRNDGTGTAVFGGVTGGSTSVDDDFFVVVTSGNFYGTD